MSATDIFTRTFEEAASGYRMRLHLRIDADKSGVLWVNAHQSFYLNSTATLFARCFMNEMTDEQAKSEIKAELGFINETVLSDYRKVKSALTDLLEGRSAPCEFLSEDISESRPFSHTPSAPYRMDLALSYLCNNNCAHCYNEKERRGLSMALNGWKAVLDRVCDLGIPHVVFTGGEPTLVPFLPDLIAYAESRGLVTGLNTNGRRFKDPDFVRALRDSGLDHTQITLESADPDIHDRMVGAKGAWEETGAGVRNCVEAGLHTITNSTLLRHNASVDEVHKLIDFLHSLGLHTFALNALIYAGHGKDVDSGLDESELPALVQAAREDAHRYDMRFLWYTPTQYCRFDPTDAHVGIKHCTAARYSMCIEPDGRLLPCQSWYQPLGSFLQDDWESLWNHPLCQDIRAGKFMPAGCGNCESRDLCGAGCPLAARYKTEIFPRTDIPADF